MRFDVHKVVGTTRFDDSSKIPVDTRDECYLTYL